MRKLLAIALLFSAIPLMAGSYDIRVNSPLVISEECADAAWKFRADGLKEVWVRKESRSGSKATITIDRDNGLPRVVVWPPAKKYPKLGEKFNWMVDHSGGQAPEIARWDYLEKMHMFKHPSLDQLWSVDVYFTYQKNSILPSKQKLDTTIFPRKEVFWQFMIAVGQIARGKGDVRGRMSYSDSKTFPWPRTSNFRTFKAVRDEHNDDLWRAHLELDGVCDEADGIELYWDGQTFHNDFSRYFMRPFLECNAGVETDDWRRDLIYLEDGWCHSRSRHRDAPELQVNEKYPASPDQLDRMMDGIKRGTDHILRYRRN